MDVSLGCSGGFKNSFFAEYLWMVNVASDNEWKRTQRQHIKISSIPIKFFLKIILKDLMEIY